MSDLIARLKRKARIAPSETDAAAWREAAGVAVELARLRAAHWRDQGFGQEPGRASWRPRYRNYQAALPGAADAESAALRKRAEAAERERDAIIDLLVDEGPETPPLWYALLPDKFSQFGLSWDEYAVRDLAVAAVRRAAGLGGGPQEGERGG